jgi:hypothetical protein
VTDINRNLCPFCVEEGERSKMYIGGGNPYCDEDGVYHRHEPNISTWGRSCSRGHNWIVKTRPACPAGDRPEMYEIEQR